METDAIKLDEAAAAKKQWPSVRTILATLLIITAVLVQMRKMVQNNELKTFWGHIHDGTTAGFTKAWKDHGDLLREIAPTGNVAVIYAGFDPAKPEDVTYVAQSHFLGEFQIYPRRVFTADETKVINKGADVINPSFAPSIEWLQQNGVQVVATYKMVPPNQLTVTPLTVPPAAPMQGGR